jgi:LAO/AO transport system ATPase
MVSTAMNERQTPQRVLLAKVGLDGHDRGIKVVARGLRDAGFHVIYSGLWQKIESVAEAGQDEDVDWLGISILNGAHMTLVPQMLDELRRRELSRVRVIVGGIIPPPDQEKLKQLGVVACFGAGSSIDSIVGFMQNRSNEIDDITSLVRRLEKGDRAALARLLSLAAADQNAATLNAALKSLPRNSTPVIALTGSGGVGKSSLLGELAAQFAGRGKRIGVLACDPESSVTGGALLGDRCRITGDKASDRVFVRSLPTPSGQQGIAPNIKLMLDLMKSFGFDRIFIETVGTGQTDTAIRQVADTVVLVVQPHTGDELQWEKAGILEVADIVVVNKSDLPGAEQTIADIKQQLHTSKEPPIPVIKTSVAHRQGIDDLDVILREPKRPKDLRGSTDSSLRSE